MKKRLQFNAQGKLVGVDNSVQWASNPDSGNDGSDNEVETLKRSDSLSFLQQQRTIEPILDDSGWSLYNDGKKLIPLAFSNGKTQEDVVNEVVELINQGKKIVLIHGVCGTGKSAIALNIARRLGKASIVVPVKGLQRQYEDDYTKKKYLVKPDGHRLSIAMITGRENHDSIIKPGVSCADPFLPDTIKIADKNFEMLRDYYLDNPLISHKVEPTAKNLKRISIAPANPYWSPIVPADYELPLKDARKKLYTGLCGKDFIFYHRKEGCSYYDQYQAYTDADVIIFNSAKFLIETALDRRPETKVDIIDEADEFLDSFSAQEELNLSRLTSALQQLYPERLDVRDDIDEIIALIKLEEQRVKAIGIDESKIFESGETKIPKIVSLLLKSPELAAEISIDELNYANTALDVAGTFKDFMRDTYVTYRRNEADLLVYLVTTNLSQKFAELQEKSSALVLMSGTLHSRKILHEIFGIKDFQIVEAETLQQGTIEIHKTGQELDCRYSQRTANKGYREQYVKSLTSAIQKARKPTLVHVHAYDDLPTEQECSLYGLSGIMTREQLVVQQGQDKTGKQIAKFKAREIPILFTTKCARGVDFPGDICNSVVFTKYPNPNVSGIFWKVLKRTHETYFWDFYRDKAYREFLQRLYRAIRSKEDHVFVLSPDIRVVDAVRELQMQNGKKLPKEYV